MGKSVECQNCHARIDVETGKTVFDGEVKQPESALLSENAKLREEIKVLTEKIHSITEGGPRSERKSEKAKKQTRDGKGRFNRRKGKKQTSILDDF